MSGEINEAFVNAESKAVSRAHALLTDLQNFSIHHDIAPITKSINEAFDKEDKDRHGILSSKELSTRMEDPSLHGEASVTAGALYWLNHELQNGQLKIDKKPNPSGLTKEELLAIENKAKAAPNDCWPGINQSREATNDPDEWGKKEFIIARKDFNSKIFHSDIKRALQTTIGDEETKKALSFLDARFDKIAQTSGHSPDAGLTLGELQKYDSQLKDTCNVRWTLENLVKWRAKFDFGNINASLSKTAASHSDITHKAIHQGRAGDCYVLSTIAAFADQRPDLIKKMIADVGNGKYKVTFPGQKVGYTVSAPSEAERTLYNNGGPNGIWATILEKAYGLYKHDSKKRGLMQMPGEVPQDYSGSGGSAAEAMSFFSNGKSRVVDLQKTSEKEIKKDLLAATSGHVPMTTTRFLPNMKQDELMGLPTDHAYEVVSYSPGGAGDGTVTIKNPQAVPELIHGDVFTMSLQQFCKSFNVLIEAP